MIYQWATNTRISGDAQEVGDEIESLRQKHGGTITGNQLLKAATGRRSLLHDYFEWDDTIAAKKFRRWQANNLLYAIVVSPGEGQDFEPVRAFVRITEDTRQSDQFTHVIVAAQDDDMSDMLEARFQRKLKALRNEFKKFSKFQEYAPLFEAIDALVA